VLSSFWFALSRFLENALSFAGWAANVYAGTLAVALTLYGFLIVRPILDAARKLPSTRNSGKRSPGAIVAWIVLAASAALAGSGVAARLIGRLGFGDAHFRFISQ
jgi:hypothetical protein